MRQSEKCKLCENYAEMNFSQGKTGYACSLESFQAENCSNLLDILVNPPRYLRGEFIEEIEEISPHIFALFKFKSEIYKKTATNILDILPKYREKIEFSSRSAYRSKKNILEGFLKSVKTLEGKKEELENELSVMIKDSYIESELKDLNRQIDFFKDSVSQEGKKFYQNLLEKKKSPEYSEKRLGEIFRLTKSSKEGKLKDAEKTLNLVYEFQKKLSKQGNVKGIESLFLSPEFKGILEQREIDYRDNSFVTVLDVSFLPESLGGNKLDKVDALNKMLSAIKKTEKLVEKIVGKINEEREVLDLATLTISPETMRDLRANGAITENDWDQIKEIVKGNDVEELIIVLKSINEEENLGFEFVRNNNFGNQEDPLWAIRSYIDGYWDFNKVKKENLS